MVVVGELDEDFGRDGALTQFVAGIGGLGTMEILSDYRLMKVIILP